MAKIFFGYCIAGLILLVSCTKSEPLIGNSNGGTVISPPTPLPPITPPPIPPVYNPSDTLYEIDLVFKYPLYTLHFDTAHGYYSLMEKSINIISSSETVFADGPVPLKILTSQATHYTLGGAYTPVIYLFENNNDLVALDLDSIPDFFLPIQNQSLAINDSCSVTGGTGRFSRVSVSSQKLSFTMQADPMYNVGTIRIKGSIAFH